MSGSILEAVEVILEVVEAAIEIPVNPPLWGINQKLMVQAYQRRSIPVH